MIHVILGAMTGGVSGALMIGILGGFVFRNFKPWPWWPDERWEFFAIGAVVGFFLGTVSGIRKMLHQQAVEAVALEMGMDFADRSDSRLAERVKMLADVDGTVSLANVISGRYQEVELVVAEMTHRSRSSGSRGNSSRTMQTIAFFRCEGLDLPRFSMQPEGFILNLVTNLVGLEDVDFDTHPEFSNAYHLSGESVENVRQLFNHDLLDFFTNHPGWKVIGEKDRLLMFRQRRRVPSRRLHEFIDATHEMLRLFADASRMTTDESFSAVEHGSAGSSRRSSADTRDNGRGEEFVTAFLDQPAPRDVPPDIARYYVGGKLVLMLLGCALCCFSIPALIVGGIAAAEGSLAAILPGIGFAVVGGAVLWGAASVRKSGNELLRNGRRADAVVESVESTDVFINGRQRYLATVRYHASGSPLVTKMAIYGGHVNMARRAMESGEPVPMLFHPTSPGKFVLSFQLMPGFPKAR